jgi:AGZA family xanthine/uracil permease-like MFS transporter
VGSNNPDGVEIKGPNAPKDANGKPLDGIPFHPYYTVHDILGVSVFLLVFSAVIFFAPELGGYFLEYNNFIPADPLKTPAHIAPVWYFTPYYSMLRAITTEMMYVLVLCVVAAGAFGVLRTELPKLFKGAILIGLVGTTILAIIIEAVAGVGPKTGADGAVANLVGWGLNVPKVPDAIVATPDLGLLGQFNLFGSFQIVGVIAAIIAIFALLLSDFFDTMGTVFGLSTEADLLDKDGEVPHLQSILIVDSIAAAAGGAASTSSNTAYIESASGIGDGARTGIASVVTGVLFLVAMFFTPLVQIVPYEAAAPALVVVGFLMMTQIRHIDFTNLEIGIPAFLIIVLMPFTYSITIGIGAGFIAWVVIKIFLGKAREINWLMWVIAIAFVLYFAVDPIRQGLGVS